MANYKVKTLLTLFTMAALLMGCTRPTEEVSTVKIQLPSMTTTGSSVMSQQAMNEGQNWGQPDPSSISEIDCWGVFVKSAESNSSVCTVGTGTSSFRALQFSEKAGLAASGSALQVDVKNGLRTFYLVGFKKGSASCENFDQLPSSNLSSPFVLGEATKEISGGSDTVTINATLNAANLNDSRIGDCKFDGAEAVSHLNFIGPVTQTGSDYQLNLKDQTCGIYYIRLSNSANGEGGGGVINLKPRELVVSYQTLTQTSAWTTEPRFYRDRECSTLVNNGDSFLIPAGENAVDVFVQGKGAAWVDGTDSGSQVFTISDPTSQLQPVSGLINIKAFAPSNPTLSFFNEKLFVAPGKTKAFEFFFTAIDGSTVYSIPRIDATFSLMNADLTAVATMPPTTSGFSEGFSTAKDSTLEVTTSTYNKSFAMRFFTVGLDWTTSNQNLAIVATPDTPGAFSASSPLYLNPSP